MVTISDTGAGTTPDVVAKVFDPFFTTKPSGKRTGLGFS
jgi:signal transduction histidine kinase